MSHASGNSDAERSEAASTTIREQHGPQDPSGVDAAPADPQQEQKEDVAAEPPSATR